MEIELWQAESGRCPVKDFLKNLDGKTFKKIERYLGLLKEHGLTLAGMVDFFGKLSGYNLYELKCRSNKIFVRIFCGISGQTCWLLHGFLKKSNKTPKREIETALNRFKETKKEI
jgi:phage-related protein